MSSSSSAQTPPRDVLLQRLKQELLLMQNDDSDVLALFPDFDVNDEYDSDANYRRQIGCSIYLYGEYGFSDSLIGLEIEWDFPHANGTCVGRVKSVKKDGYEEGLNVYWTFGDNKEVYLLPMEAHDVLECYFHKNPKSAPSWLDLEQKFASPLFRLDPKKTTLSNFQLPFHAIETFPWVEKQEDDRWFTTLACLNDPLCAPSYDPRGDRAYPLGLLLTLIVICKYYDPSTKLPMTTRNDEDSKRTRALSDKYARMLTDSSDRVGVKELANLVKITNELKKKSTAFAAIKSPTLRDAKDAVILCEAIILTMSCEFEQNYDSWYMSSGEEIDMVSYELVMGLGRVLLHPSAESAIKELDNATTLSTHLPEGNYVQFTKEDYFRKEYPDAKQVWDDLLQFAQGLETL